MMQEAPADVCQWGDHCRGAEGEEQRERLQDRQGQLEEGRVHELLHLLRLAKTEPEKAN